jgi:uncharacterized membrane protein YgdD (TMEM256/DUF423 family)
MLAVYHTAVQYHFWHALALLGVALASTHLPDSLWLRSAGWLFVAGLLLFCGSLYALAFGAPRQSGLITPLGGLCFILAWLAFAGAALRS